jgi:hypothetical protein
MNHRSAQIALFALPIEFAACALLVSFEPNLTPRMSTDFIETTIIFLLQLHILACHLGRTSRV